MSSLPPLAGIRVFEAAGRHEHFSRAAEELGMTQAAVSYQVRQLEERLGEKLFERAGNGVRLSATGKRLHGPVAEGFAAIRQAFADHERGNEEVLGVTAPVSFGTTWLAEAIGRFQLDYPDLALRLSVSNELTDLQSGDMDCGIRIGGGSYPGIRSHFLFRLYLTPMCSPEYAKSRGLKTPANLLEAERINQPDPLWPQYFASAGLPSDFDASIGIALENQAQEASVAIAGQGVALLTPLFWRRELADGRLVAPIDHVFLPELSHWLVYPERRVGVRKIERFREWLTSALHDSALGIPEEALVPAAELADRAQET